MFRFATLHYSLNVDNVINTTVTGDETLLDADIVVADPGSFHEIWEKKIHQGSDGISRVFSPDSDRIRRAFKARQNEIETLLENGKIVIVLTAPVTGFTGQKDNRRNHSIVSNYDFLPINQTFLRENITGGKSSAEDSIILKDHNNPFSQFYKAFKKELTYKAYLDIESEENNLNFLINRSHKPVGFHVPVDDGLIVFLPYPNYKFKNEKLIGVLSGCAKSTLSDHKKSPPPNWIEGYKLKGEDEFDSQIDEAQNEIKKKQEKLDSLTEQKKDLTKYKALLYEQGHELEDVIIEALKLMGFKAENRTLDDIEHDIIFESEEGRGIAEVEGKDNDAIHIGKLDQLNRAVDEDFDLTDEYPQGILIGNHFRYTKPEKRTEPFTEKVLIVAQKKSFGLLTTVELYQAVKKILEEPDNEEFKAHCRKKILITEGEIIKI